MAKGKAFLVGNQGDLELSMGADDLSVSFMKKGSAVVGPKDEEDAILLYKGLGKKARAN